MAQKLLRKNTHKSTKDTYKTKDRVTRTSSGVSSSCSTSGTHRINLVTNPVISHEMRKGPGSVYENNIHAVKNIPYIVYMKIAVVPVWPS
jgi:hypothetical protein